MRREDLQRCVDTLRAEREEILSKMCKADLYALEHSQMEARILWWAEDGNISMECFAQGDTSWYNGTAEIYRVSYRFDSPVDLGGWESVEDYWEDMEEEHMDQLREELQRVIHDLEMEASEDFWI